jgi:hypothetical protein
MNQYEFIIALVFIVGAISILRSRLGARPIAERPAGDGENDRLRGQVQQLQERIRVLERIVTDRGAQTAAQIEALREHDRISEEDKA